MPQIQSAKKRMRQNITKALRHSSRKTRVRTYVGRVEKALEDKTVEEAQSSLKSAMSELHRAVTKKTIPLKTASRKISRLNARVKLLAQTK